MATGDDALAAGMPLVNGNAANSAPAIDDYINETRDFIAQRTSAVTPVEKGGTASTSAAAARAALGVTALLDTKLTRTSAEYSADFAARDSSISAAQSAAATAQAGVNWVGDGNMTTTVYNRMLSGAYRVLYVSASGLLGWVSSSRRHKKNIRRASVDPRAVLSMELVTFLYKSALDTEGDKLTQWGLIAEQLDELGLTWLVDYGDGNLPEGVRYDRIALALLPVVQYLDDRITALESRDAPTS